MRIGGVKAQYAIIVVQDGKKRKEIKIDLWNVIKKEAKVKNPKKLAEKDGIELQLVSE